MKRWACSFLILFLLVWTGLALAGCQPSHRVVIVADDRQWEVSTTAGTVAEVLREAGVTLDTLDRIEPDRWTTVRAGMTITVIRVHQKEVSVLMPVPYQQQVIRDEGTPRGETRLLQVGANGEEELIFRVTYENEQETTRDLITRRVTQEPQREVIVVGTRGLLASAAFTGTVAYLAGDNAWVMRHRSGTKRPLTFASDLDHRVFDLSPDGSWLLFTRRPRDPDDETALNELWLVGTRQVGDEPVFSGIRNVLWAQWGPDSQTFAYSTAEPRTRSPGWKANNDLVVAVRDVVTKTQVLPPSARYLYAWWGYTFAWSPDGTQFACATPDGVHLIDRASGQWRTLLTYPVYHSYADWIWTSSLDWSPDGRRLLCVAHGDPQGGEIPEDSTVFDIWSLDTQGRAHDMIAHNVGMWSMPCWSPQGDLILYGLARDPTRSHVGPYDLYLARPDGSEARRLFPTPGQIGLALPEALWAPAGDAVVAAYLQDLYRVPLAGTPQPLTDSGSCSWPQWSP
ncbi:MAG: G5 domain-containing protein [Chloroflexi bacterium]|nr:G5 domain-containing protein [Chloroflexota bacterium]MBU1747497.1 G5 domain-containing protein [Chloroflexota bacterium]MBU1878049.1 G5 domain-containing protein [Chloroflexota bacterium]